VEFRHIDAFRALMLTRTTTKAAALIGASQPAVSRCLSELESLTNLTLFDRQSGRLIPTRAAELFFEEVQRRYTGLEYLREFAMQLATPRAATIRLGSLITYSYGYFGSVLAQFRRRHAEAKVVLTVGSSDVIRDQLLAGSVELGIVAAGRDLSQFQQKAAFLQNAICAIPAGHPLARKKSISLAELAEHPLIAYQEEDMIRWGLTKLMSRHAEKVDIVAVVRYASNVCALVAEGVGVGLVQSISAYDHIRDDRIVFRRLVEEITFHTYVLAPASLAISPLAEDLVEILRSTYETLQEKTLQALV
jgi:DNA-binding transcriptional LysR family regulator